MGIRTCFTILAALLLAACAAQPGSRTGTPASPPGGAEIASRRGETLPARPTPPVEVAALSATAAASAPPSPGTNAPGAFAGWSAMVIAADNRANDGSFTNAFDNARREAARRLLAWGLRPGDLAQYSVMPEAFPEEALRRLTLSRFSRDLATLKMRTGKGCFFYLTSHGTRQGLSFNQDTLSPGQFWDTVGRLCGQQPVVAVISACHSGVFAEDQWHAPNRFIFTAARADRTSFGCGKDNEFPYFDACFLKAAETTVELSQIAERTRACVRDREATEKLLPSEPQLFVGAKIKQTLPTAPK